MTVKYVIGVFLVLVLTGSLLYVDKESKKNYKCRSELNDIEMSITEYNWLNKVFEQRDGVLHLTTLDVKGHPSTTMILKFMWVERWSRLGAKDILFDWRFSKESGDLTIKSKIQLFDGNCEVLNEIT